MPELGDLPQHGQHVFSNALKSCMADTDYGEPRCIKIAWGAVKNAGYYQDKDGKWKKRKEGEAMFMEYWADKDVAETAVGEQACLCDRREAIERIMIQERLIPYYAKILAAVPGRSLNRRNYTPEVLSSAGPAYAGKPFILDHDYEDSRKVHGKIVNYKYGVDESPLSGRQHTGLWLDGVGLMDEDLYARIKGDEARGIPPLLRGVSIGGEGDGDMTLQGIDIKSFQPTELSITAFAGIPEAHIATFEEIPLIAESIYPKRPRPRSSVRMPEQARVKDFSVRRTTELGPNLMEKTPAVALIREGPPVKSPDSHTKRPAAIVPMPQVGAPDVGFKVTPEFHRAVQALAADGNKLMNMMDPNPIRSGEEEEEEEEVAYAGADKPFTTPHSKPDKGPPLPYVRGTDPDREPLPGEEEISVQVSRTKEGETLLRISKPNEGTATPPADTRGPAPYGAKVGGGEEEEAKAREDHDPDQCDKIHPGMDHDAYMKDEEGTDTPPEPGRDTPLPGAGEEEEEANPVLKAAGLESAMTLEQRDMFAWQAHAPSLPPEQFKSYVEVMKQIESVMPKTRTTTAKPVQPATESKQQRGKTPAKPRVVEVGVAAGLPPNIGAAIKAQPLTLRETIFKTLEETRKETKGQNLSVLEEGRLAWLKTVPEIIRRTARK